MVWYGKSEAWVVGWWDELVGCSRSLGHVPASTGTMVLMPQRLHLIKQHENINNQHIDFCSTQPWIVEICIG